MLTLLCGRISIQCDACGLTEAAEIVEIDVEATAVMVGTWHKLTLESQDHPQCVRADLCSGCAAAVFGKLRRYEV